MITIGLLAVRDSKSRTKKEVCYEQSIVDHCHGNDMVFNNWRMTHTEKLPISAYSDSSLKSFKKIIFYTDLGWR